MDSLKLRHHESVDQAQHKEHVRAYGQSACQSTERRAQSADAWDKAREECRRRSLALGLGLGRGIRRQWTTMDAIYGRFVRNPGGCAPTMK